MAEKWIKMIFPDHSVNRKVVDNVENYPNMIFQPIPMTYSRENGQKLSNYDISAKTNDAFSRKWPKTLFSEKMLIKKFRIFRRKSGFVTFLHL